MTKNLEEQGYTQEKGIDYDEFFALVARIEAIRLFLAYALFKDFVVYQMDVKSAFLYGKIKEEVHVCQPLGFKDPDFPNRVYKVEKALYGLHQAPRAWYETLSTYLLDNGFQRGKIDKNLFIRRDKVKQKNDGIFISKDKYVTEILQKFGFTDVKTASTPMETRKLLLKDKDGEEVDVHLYRSMISSLMYLTSSRPDIMFAVCACARYQVNRKISHLHAVKRIFSDYVGASLDRKFTTGDCQFLGSRLISWQCKKQTVVANSTTEAEYVVASSCCRQNGIGVNTGNSKLMLLGVNLLLLGKDNAARHILTAAEESILKICCCELLMLVEMISLTQFHHSSSKPNTMTTLQFAEFSRSQEIPTPIAFQTDDMDAFDSDSDETPSACAIIDQSVQEMKYFEQPVFNNNTDTNISNDSNMISYEQYLKETETTMTNQVAKCNEIDKENKLINESLNAELEKYKEQIKLFEERQQFDLNNREKYIDDQLRMLIVDKNAKVTDTKNQIHSLKQQLNATVESHKPLLTTVDVLKIESNEKEDKYLDETIELEYQKKALALGYQNPLYLSQAQRKVHTLYCGNTIIKKHATLSVIDTKETLKLAKESRLKVHAKQNYLIVQENKVNIAPIDYVALNKLSEHFVPQKQLSTEHAFWLLISKPVSKILLVQPEPVPKEIPRELLTINMVHTTVNTLAAIADYKKMEQSYVDEYNECLELKIELLKKNDMVDKAIYNELSKRCARLENQCIFEIFELKSQLKAKDNSISKLKDHIATFKGKRVISSTSDSELKPPERTFTIDGNMCPLTRITSTIVVPPKKPIFTTVVKKTPPSSKISGKLKDITNIGSSSKSKNVKSKIYNNSKLKKIEDPMFLQFHLLPVSISGRSNRVGIKSLRKVTAAKVCVNFAK
ncbi:putative ribonuclease H-like domain-containing protein [Tanacetum coccineum]|uniref:Ribonuclease H-like domain-containing protein n=1 Tax=Tanacetum coccineum TaxID=301880 RepID=A0ABQ5BGE0_9ASTR